MDVLVLLPVWGVVAVVWAAIGMLDARRKTEGFFQQLDAERERGHDGIAHPDPGAERRIA
jgi:hypothetical protein